jgi:prevent-host-death family protein
MIDVTQDIHSLTKFKRNSSGLMRQMRKTGRPLVLTVKGKAEVVVVDAAAYQEVASQLDAVASVRRGLAQARKGAGRPADATSGPLIALSATKRHEPHATGFDAHDKLQRPLHVTPNAVR